MLPQLLTIISALVLSDGISAIKENKICSKVCIKTLKCIKDHDYDNNLVCRDIKGEYPSRCVLLCDYSESPENDKSTEMAEGLGTNLKEISSVIDVRDNQNSRHSHGYEIKVGLLDGPLYTNDRNTEDMQKDPVLSNISPTLTQTIIMQTLRDIFRKTNKRLNVRDVPIITTRQVPVLRHSIKRSAVFGYGNLGAGTGGGLKQNKICSKICIKTSKCIKDYDYDNNLVCRETKREYPSRCVLLCDYSESPENDMSTEMAGGALNTEKGRKKLFVWDIPNFGENRMEDENVQEDAEVNSFAPKFLQKMKYLFGDIFVKKRKRRASKQLSRSKRQCLTCGGVGIGVGVGVGYAHPYAHPYAVPYGHPYHPAAPVAYYG